MSLSLKEHLERAGAFVGLLKKHKADLDDLANDVPKAISIAHDFHKLFKEQDVQASIVAAQATAPQAAPLPTPKPAAAPHVTAHQAVQHVRERGLSEAERGAFDRASQSVG